MTDARRILEASGTVLLVDWPNPGVPRALLDAAFKVFSFCPGRYSVAELVADRPPDLDGQDIFAPGTEEERGCLVFRRIEGRPGGVGIVYVHRPAEELAGIVANQILPLGAKVVWLQPPVSSTEIHEAQRLAREHGLVCVHDADIAEMARAVARTR